MADRIAHKMVSNTITGEQLEWKGSPVIDSFF